MAGRELVCVTGAGGYLASWLVKFLLEKRYVVHGTVRDPCDDKNSHLKALEYASENLQLYKADLLDYEGLYAAIEGCDGVFHVATPVSAPVANPEVEIVEPAVVGARNVVNACVKAKVKKVVVVSSVAAIIRNPNWSKDHVLDEECWSSFDNSKPRTGWDWYDVSKTSAEQEAVGYADRNELNLVTVCPSLIIGPMLQPKINSSSNFLLLLFGKSNLGEFYHSSSSSSSAAANDDEQMDNEKIDFGSIGLVDVRDAAESLLLVYEKADARGRYICNSYVVRVEDVVEKMKKLYPNYNYPKSYNEDIAWPKLSSKKLQALGWTYRTLEDTIIDSFNNYVDRGELTKK
ncbi:hypothetical protein K2173_007413 [Erythroxylum novogranatense]|uniref:NAD-dependent epimerase/dehydratase domain-containing protein n=1 Tax=Erythroxylum novogranatense TaxID=1862640 RepID=A0AAV8T6E6_9ROSI|nr:hypothetical protein K2173_007413 [Erythroxylum novogranatense]